MLELGDGCCHATVCAGYFPSVCALLASVVIDNHCATFKNDKRIKLACIYGKL